MPCSAPATYVDGVKISSSQFENDQDLIKAVGDDQSDPTADAYDESVAGGNNNRSTTGIQQGDVTQTAPPAAINGTASASNTTPPPYNAAAGVTCTIWDGTDYNVYMSPNYTLRSFTLTTLTKNELITAFGMSAQTRFCNLQAVSQRIVEPLRVKFGTLNINSGLRNKNTSAGLSQHCKGEAVDIQFPNWTYDMYWQNAQWVKDNIPYDQFIFEHSDKTKKAWYHLSFNQAGNRAVTDRTKVMTMYRNGFDSGLKKYF